MTEEGWDRVCHVRALVLQPGSNGLLRWCRSAGRIAVQPSANKRRRRGGRSMFRGKMCSGALSWQRMCVPRCDGQKLSKRSARSFWMTWHLSLRHPLSRCVP